jgi:isoamylase
VQPGLTRLADHDAIGVYSPDARSVELAVLAEDGSERRVPLAPDPTGSGDWTALLDPLPPGTRYGLRAAGDSDPHRGRVFESDLLLLDPYARAVTTLGGRPVAVAVDRELDAGTTWRNHPRPVVAADQRVIAELHVRGYTRTHPGVPEPLRGTYVGLASPAVTDHLLGLGVTTVELLPIHQFFDEPRLVAAGLCNYWGYNTAAFFAPHAAYSSRGSRGGQVADVKAMVAGLHAAGLEVILDVVYNHTAEQGLDLTPTSLRGLADRATYRRVNADGSGAYLDVTGCGNTLDTTNLRTLSLVMDSLRYWLGEVGVDGFRFDLATALARTSTARGSGFDPLSPVLAAIAQDPVCRAAVLIAEPWDVGYGGYQLGAFGAGWAEWNDRFRDTTRQFWRRVPVGPDGSERRRSRRVDPAAAVRDVASRLAGSSDVFSAGGRGPLGSVNYVCAHDGFTLADVVSYDQKHNDANGEDNRDGTDGNLSWNHGVEGPTTDETVLGARLRTMRNMLATMLLAAGTPMLLGGDESGRTQRGNNNAYCHDDELTWVDWSWLASTTPAQQPAYPGSGRPLVATRPKRGRNAARLLPDGAAGELVAWVTGLLRLRSQLALLRPTLFLRGDGPHVDLLWLRSDGATVTAEEWWSPARQTLGMLRLPAPDRPGADEPPLLLWLHTEDRAEPVRLPGADLLIPGLPGGDPGTDGLLGWAELAESTNGTLYEPGRGPLRAAGSALVLAPRSMRLLEAVRGPR